MFGLGAGEMLIILAFALIFIGPKKLPELARNLGKGLREFQKAKDDFMSHVESEKDDIKQAIAEHDTDPESDPTKLDSDSEEHHPSLTGVHEPHEISDEEVAAEANSIAEALKKAEEEEGSHTTTSEKEKPPTSQS